LFVSDTPSTPPGEAQDSEPKKSASDVEVAPPESEAGEESSWFWEILTTWGPAFLAVLVVRSMLVEPFRIPSGSMVPTLEIGDNIVVTKFSYGFRIPLTRIPITEVAVPERGDVVVFVFPGQDTGVKHWVDLPVPPFATMDYVKRVVGIPGDVVEMRDQILYVNGEARKRESVDEFEFVDDTCRGKATKRYQEDFDGKPHEILYDQRYTMTSKNFGPITVPEGEIFVMGDNRDNSYDSRAWSTVPLRNIKGKAQFIWLSWDVCEQRIPVFGDIRTDRMGLAIP
jgi:signal peptidase I